MRALTLLCAIACAVGAASAPADAAGQNDGDADPECLFDAATAALIHAAFTRGADTDAAVRAHEGLKLACVATKTGGEVGQLAGAVAGAAAGGSAGRWAAGALTGWLCRHLASEDADCAAAHASGEDVGALLGAAVGLVGGAVAGEETGKYVTLQALLAWAAATDGAGSWDSGSGTGDAAGGGRPSGRTTQAATLAKCHALFGLPPRVPTAPPLARAAILRAHRSASMAAHPDKPGGSQEAQLRVNYCKIALLAANGHAAPAG
jgi:hypothetical protein